MKRTLKKQKQQEWPVVVYFWMIGLFFMTYIISRMVLEAYPHQFHWLSIPIGLTGAILGIPFGWLWFRWRGDII
ncbi:MAG: hypothetical protein WBL25_21090 [Anaerolineales bacterium]